MGKLIVAANRLPVSVSKQRNELHICQSPGGLAVGLASLPDSVQRLWLGWPGISTDHLEPRDKEQITRELAVGNCLPVFLSQEQIDQYYSGFCNETIWPLFHYFPARAVFEERFWEAYRQVNDLFCEELAQVVEPDDSVWIHDFQLMLLPRLLREKVPELKIGYFLHIPWPAFELFGLLPWREEILRGLLGADLIGFHTYDYVRHFLNSVSRLAGLEHTLGEVNAGNRILKVDAFPMGIDYEKYAHVGDDPAVRAEADEIRGMVGDRRIILSIDRLDYTKGILERLEAFNQLLVEHPEYKGDVALILVAVPSRTEVEDYRLLRERLEQLVSRINGKHGTLGYMPVWYLYRHMPFTRLAALYITADVGLVTPLRDGMNLIAKEFVAAKADGAGVLILSEMAGAASELGEALIVNACDRTAIVRALQEALEMPVSEQQERNRVMQERLRRYNVGRWCTDFLDTMADVGARQRRMAVHRLSAEARKTLYAAYANSDRRLLLLDYDGTLVGFTGRPARAGPDQEVIELLRRLAADERNNVVIISGRDRNTLEKWLGELGTSLVAEHGGWVREQGQPWRSFQPVNGQWKNTLRPILELFSDRTPGSFVEEKDFSLVWHYRRADSALAYVRTHELRDALVSLTENMDVGVFEGSKILEIRKYGVGKGRIVEYFLTGRNWRFLLAAGDDYTDEEMFAVMPETAYSIRVGLTISKARFNVDTVQDIRSLLRKLAGC